MDDQVKAYVKKIMSQLSKWMQKSKISKLVVVITSKETGEHLERWQFDVSSPLSMPFDNVRSDSGFRLVALHLLTANTTGQHLQSRPQKEISLLKTNRKGELGSTTRLSRTRKV